MDELEKRQIKRHSGKEAAQITNECLQQALLKLLKTKNIDKITVTELTKLAGVSRSSFYRRYDEPMDLLKEIAESYITDMIASLFSEKYKNNPREWFYEVFKNASQHPELFLKSIKIDSTDYERLLSLSISDDLLVYNTIEEHYINIVFEYAIKGVLTDWLYYGMKESVDEITDISYKIFKTFLPVIFKKAPERK